MTATMANGSEGRVHAQLSLKLQLLSLLVADTDPGETDQDTVDYSALGLALVILASWGLRQ